MRTSRLLLPSRPRTKHGLGSPEGKDSGNSSGLPGTVTLPVRGEVVSDHFYFPYPSWRGPRGHHAQLSTPESTSQSPNLHTHLWPAKPFWQLQLAPRGPPSQGPPLRQVRLKLHSSGETGDLGRKYGEATPWTAGRTQGTWACPP